MARGVTGRVLATFFRSSTVACGKQFSRKFSNSRLSNDRLDYTFKAKILTFLQSDTNYKKINMLEMPVSLTFDTGGIDWRSKSIAQFMDALSVEEIIQMLHQMKPQDPTQSRLLDRILADRLRQSSAKEILLLTNGAMKVFREQMANSLFYRVVLEFIPQLVESCSSSEQLIFWSFLCSLNKKNSSAIKGLRRINQRFENDFDLEQLTFMEMSILCNNLFMGGVKMSPRSLQVVERVFLVEMEGKEITADSLPFIKVMRHAEYSTHKLLHSLTKALISHKSPDLDLALLAHVLAMLADNRYLASDELINSVFQCLEICIQNNKSIYAFHPKQGIRAKDLTRFLWALTCIRPAFTSLPLSTANKVIDYLVQQVEIRWTKDLFGSNHLAWDFLLSLAVWQIYPKNLIEKILNNQFAAEVLTLEDWRNQSRRLSLLVLFIEAARIEAPHVRLPAQCQQIIDRYRPVSGGHKGLKKRMFLTSLYKALIQHAPNENWQDFRYDTTLVPNVAGITFTYKG